VTATAVGDQKVYGKGSAGQLTAEMTKMVEEANKRFQELEQVHASMAQEKQALALALAEAQDRLKSEAEARAAEAEAAESTARELDDTRAKLSDAEGRLVTQREAAEQTLADTVAAAAAKAKEEAEAKAKGEPSTPGSATRKPATPTFRKAAGDALSGDQKAKINSLTAQVKELQKEVAGLNEKLRSADKVSKQNAKDKQLLENKLQRLEKSSAAEAKASGEKAEKEAAALHKASAEKDKKVLALSDQVADLQSQLAEQLDEVKGAAAATQELEELRELKADVDRKDKAAAEIIKQQKDSIEELEGKYREEQTLRKRYFNMMEDMKGKIRVFARTRPLSSKETSESQAFAMAIPDEFTMEHPWKEEKKPRSYQFDRVFGANASQEEVFEDCRYLVQSAVDGYNVCVFAYGQTGSGKTHTINGYQGAEGLTPRAVGELFDIVNQEASKASFTLKVTMLELYQENLNDLLLAPGKGDRPKLDIKKDPKGWVTVTNSTSIPVTTAAETLDTLATGLAHRKVANTNMNTESSRSHQIFSIIIEATDLQTQAVTKGKLSFVDLAGSERVKKSGSSGDQLKEAQAINKSLSALGDVISALATEQTHIPYRNHKLTMLMSDSLGGNAKTLMFVNVSPTDGNLEESQNSLQYATRVRTIKNDASKNTANREMVKLMKQIEHWKSMAGKAGQEADLTEIEDSRPAPESA